MSEKNLHMDHEELIVRYLIGEATDTDVHQLEAWVMASDQNRQKFLDSKRAFNLTSLQKDKQFNKDKAWENIKAGISPEHKAENTGSIVNLKTLKFKVWRIAAAVAILIIAIGAWYYTTIDRGELNFGSESIVLVNEMPDGSIISLNRHSSISYKKEAHRNVKLKGDAFFEVYRDEKHPFVVEADELKIRVLGTSFYVNAQSSSPTVEVMVRSGRVAVNFKQDSIILSAGQSAIFDKANKSLTKTLINDVNYLSWKTKTLVFEDMDLQEVVKKLNQVYDSQIILDNEKLKTCKITVTFKQQELDAVLSVIAEQFDLKIDREGSKINLKGTACD